MKDRFEEIFSFFSWTSGLTFFGNVYLFLSFVHEKSIQYLVIESLLSAGTLKAGYRLQAKNNMRNNLIVVLY